MHLHTGIRLYSFFRVTLLYSGIRNAETATAHSQYSPPTTSQKSRTQHHQNKLTIHGRALLNQNSGDATAAAAAATVVDDDDDDIETEKPRRRK